MADTRPRGASAVAEPEKHVEDWAPEVAVADPRNRSVQWDGQRTRFRAAYPMMRDQKILVPGDAFEVAASFDTQTRRWVGPEAQHVEMLFVCGQILGSREAETRARLQAAIEHERGVHPTRDDPEGRPDLAPYTPEEVRNQWRRVLGGGQPELSRAERQNARSGDASTDYLAQQIAQLLAGRPQHAGAEAPGTAPEG